MIPVALAEENMLLRTALVQLIEGLGDYKIVLQASNGNELIRILQPEYLPELILLGLSLPHTDGVASAKTLSEKYPQLKIIALIGDEGEVPVAGMIKNGIRGYIKIDAGPKRIREALAHVLKNGFYIPHSLTGSLMHSFQHNYRADMYNNYLLRLTEREKEFMKFSCTEMTYKEIAQEMEISPRTVDGYRDGLFEKLGVKSRVGLALFAIRAGLVNIN
jgi:two-component system, NarL family, invasion response regulator UvrY